MAADVGSLIDLLVALKGQLARLKNAVKAKQEEIEATKQQMREALGAQGLTEGRNGTHSARIVELLVPQSTSWDQTYDYIHENRYYHLLHRRLSVEGCRELWASGTSIPGVEPFKTIDISLRKV